MSKMTEKDQTDWYERTHKHWRAWGSWFSWGSPVGLGLFFLLTTGAIWILTQIQSSGQARTERSTCALFSFSLPYDSLS